MLEWLAARAVMYRLLGEIFTFPISAGTLQGLMGFQAGPDAPPVFRDALFGMQSRLCEDPDQLLEELNTELSRLLCGPGLSPVVPYASYYLDSSRALFGPETQAVAKLYRAHGYAPAHPGTPADHIALELEFLAAMAESALVAAERQETAELQRGLTVQTGFLKHHLGPFLAWFCSDLRASSSEPFFENAAGLLAEFVAMDTEFIEAVQATAVGD